MKLLLELALSGTMFVAGLVIMVAARRFSRFRAFWASVIVTAIGVAGTSYTIFTLVFHAPAVESSYVAIEYLIFQVIKMLGLIGLVATVIAFVPRTARLEECEEALDVAEHALLPPTEG